QIAAEFLRVQAAAGVSAVQLFDSWVGALSAADYRRFVQPHSATVLRVLAEQFPALPRIHFGVGTRALPEPVAEAGAPRPGGEWGGGRGLAYPAGRGGAPADHGRHLPGRAGQPRSVRTPGSLGRGRPRGAAGTRRRVGGRRAYLQPGARRAAGDRPGGADPG